MALDPKTLATIIKAHVKRAEEEHENWDRYRAFYRCERWGNTNPDSEELFIENGHLFGFVDTMTASVVPHGELSEGQRRDSHGGEVQRGAA